MKKPSLAQRALAFLKGGDEQKLVRFETKLPNYFKKQIQIRKDEIEVLEERKSDLQDALKEIIPAVNLSRIGAIGDLEAYIPEYVQTVGSKITAIEAIDELIEVQELEIANLERIQATIESEEYLLPTVEEEA